MALSDTVRKAYAQTGGGGRAAALPDRTTVRATIFPKKDTDYIEKVNFAREGRNSSIQAWNIRFVVPEGEPNANRNFFARVPRAFEIFGRDGGKIPSYLSLQLAKALGYSEDDLDDDSLSKFQDRELLGKSVNLVLGVEDDLKWDEYLNELDSEDRAKEEQKAATNPLYKKRNVVKFINAPRTTSKPAVSASSRPTPAPADDPWNTSAPTGEDPWATEASKADAVEPTY